MSCLLLAGVFTSHVLGYGYIIHVVVNGVSYEGPHINSFPYVKYPPLVAAWGTGNTGNGFPTSGYNSPNICYDNATNSKGCIPVAAGDSISLQWTSWPDTYHGSTLDYLANCGSSC